MSTRILTPSATVSRSHEQSAARFSQWAALGGSIVFAAIPIVWWPVIDALTSGVLYVDPPTPEMMRWHALRHLLEVPGPALLAIGLIDLYRRARVQLGVIGQIGLGLLVVGLTLRALLALGIVISEGLLSTPVKLFELVHPSPVIAMLGSLLFGFAALRGQVVVRPGALLVFGAAVAIFVELFSVGFAEGTGWLIAEGLMAVNALGFVLIGLQVWRAR